MVRHRARWCTATSAAATLGYPTANLRLGPDCGLKHGIYAVRVGVGGARYDGVASFGRRPTFDNGAPLLEVFLFDFSGDLYGAALDVAFIGWIRPEMKFDSVEDLIRRMDQDRSQARHAAGAGAGRVSAAWAIARLKPLPAANGRLLHSAP